MIRRAASAAIAAILIAATAVAGPAAAQAEDAWQTTLKCATGAFTSAKVVIGEPGTSETWLDGWIQPCDQPGPNDRFGVIYYTGEPVDGQLTGRVLLRRLRSYDAMTVGGKVGTTWFSGTVDEGMRSHGPLLALCVAYDDGGILGCADPNKDGGTTGPATMELLARAPVIQVPGGVETNPNCGTCL